MTDVNKTMRSLPTCTWGQHIDQPAWLPARPDHGRCGRDAPTSGQATQADLAATGITYCRLDHWTHHGLLRDHSPNLGSGRTRPWPITELAIARTTACLCAIDLAIIAAHRVAGGLPLAGGVDVQLDPDTPDAHAPTAPLVS